MCVVVSDIGDFDRASKEMFGLREVSKSSKVWVTNAYCIQCRYVWKVLFAGSGTSA